MKKIILLLLIVAIFYVGYLIVSEDDKELSIKEHREDDFIKSLEVVDENEETVYLLSIDDFREWAKENWEDIFEEAPKIGGREVDPDYFSFFDPSSSLSPDFKTLAFSVHDYAAASTITFIGKVDLENNKISILEETKRGGVNQPFKWSKSGEEIAYTTNTARAMGDFLYLDNLKKMENNFSLSEDDLMEYLEFDLTGQFMPSFRDIRWEKERLFFLTDHPEDREIVLYWSIDKEGESLTLEGEEGREVTFRGNLMINNPGMREGVFYLSYQESGFPGGEKELILEEETDCLDDREKCISLFSKDPILSGEKVEVKGVLERGKLSLKSLEFLEEEACNYDFEDFLSEIYQGEGTEINFENYPQALNFQTRIEDSYREGPNFAGKYVLVVIGCGTNCEHLTLINYETGEVLSHGLNASHGFEFYPDSRLLVVNPPENLDHLEEGDLFYEVESKYYLLEEEELILICSI